MVLSLSSASDDKLKACMESLVAEADVDLSVAARVCAARDTRSVLLSWV